MPQRCKFARIRGPDVEVFAAVAWRGMNEAGAGVVSDMVAGQKRNMKVITTASLLSG